MRSRGELSAKNTKFSANNSPHDDIVRHPSALPISVILVVAAALYDFHRIANDSVHKPVLLIDTSAPPSCIVTTELLGLAKTCVPISLDVCDEFMDALEKVFVLLAGCVVLPSLFSE